MAAAARGEGSTCQFCVAAGLVGRRAGSLWTMTASAVGLRIRRCSPRRPFPELLRFPLSCARRGRARRLLSHLPSTPAPAWIPLLRSAPPSSLSPRPAPGCKPCATRLSPLRHPPLAVSKLLLLDLECRPSTRRTSTLRSARSSSASSPPQCASHPFRRSIPSLCHRLTRHTRRGYGITTMQTYLYSSRFPRDPQYLKAIVRRRFFQCIYALRSLMRALSLLRCCVRAGRCALVSPPCQPSPSPVAICLLHPRRTCYPRAAPLPLRPLGLHSVDLC